MNRGKLPLARASGALSRFSGDLVTFKSTLGVSDPEIAGPAAVLSRLGVGGTLLVHS